MELHNSKLSACCTNKRTDVWSRPSCIYTQIISSPKKVCVFCVFRVKKKSKRIFYKKGYYATFQCGRYMQCFQKKLRLFFDLKSMKNPLSKVAHNWLRPFYFTVQPRPQPTAHSPELIFHTMKSRDQTSVLLSMVVDRL